MHVLFAKALSSHSSLSTTSHDIGDLAGRTFGAASGKDPTNNRVRRDEHFGLLSIKVL